MQYYKVLNEDGSCLHGGSGSWFLPEGDEPGEWMPRIETVEMCSRGYHVLRRGDLVHWLGPVIFEVEVRGEVIEGDDKCVAHEARLVRQMGRWNERTARLFAADCAEEVLPLFEKAYPHDDRPRLAIEAARAFAEGKIGADEMAAALDAAGAAALAAARAAALDAAGAAAGAAAWAAAGAAAWAAAWARQTVVLWEYLEGVRG